MRKAWGVCVVLTVSSLVGTMVRGDEPAEPAGVAWHRNLQTAHTVAVRENKPILLVFGAEWCGWCKRLEDTTLADRELSEYINKNFASVHLDVDEGQGERVSEILEVDSLPCTVIVTPRAELIDRFLGYQDVQEFHQKLSAALERHAELTRARAVSATR